MAVRSGAPKPDISTVDAFKRALLASKAVAFPGKGASGIYFVSLLDRMGIKAEMQSKLKPMEAEDTVEVVARGCDAEAGLNEAEELIRTYRTSPASAALLAKLAGLHRKN